MRDEYVDFLVDKGLEAVNTRMKYAAITTPEGKTLYVSENKPLNPAMVTDFYQLTMCAAYLMNDKQDDMATFNMLYRTNPFQGAYTIFMGLERILEFLKEFQYTGEDIDFLRAQYKMPERLWEYLRELPVRLTCEAMLEGSMAQPYLPLIQITAPLPMANIIETQLLTITGYPTMVGTKAARVTSQSPNPWLEFGLRGAPDFYSSLEASKAAYICGGSGTSNVAAHQVYNVPAKGTMSHAFIMAFPKQLDSFVGYGKVFGKDSVFLIDTYGHIEGAKDAIKAAEILGLDTFRGTRDDSGDLAAHSREVRKILDDNGFERVKISASNEIDEYKRHELLQQGSAIDFEGCGRRIVTMPDSGMVYKLVQLEMASGELRYTIKISANDEKITDPGRKSVYRFTKDGYYDGDIMMLDLEEKPRGSITARHRQKRFIYKKFEGEGVPLLHTFIDDGDIIYSGLPTTDELKHFVSEEMKKMWPEMLRLSNPAEYPTYVSKHAQSIKDILIEKRAIRL